MLLADEDQGHAGLSTRRRPRTASLLLRYPSRQPAALPTAPEQAPPPPPPAPAVGVVRPPSVRGCCGLSPSTRPPGRVGGYERGLLPLCPGLLLSHEPGEPGGDRVGQLGGLPVGGRLLAAGARPDVDPVPAPHPLAHGRCSGRCGWWRASWGRSSCGGWGLLLSLVGPPGWLGTRPRRVGRGWVWAGYLTARPRLAAAFSRSWIARLAAGSVCGVASRRRRPLAAIDLPAARTRGADLVTVGDEVGRDGLPSRLPEHQP